MNSNLVSLSAATMCLLSPLVNASQDTKLPAPHEEVAFTQLSKAEEIKTVDVVVFYQPIYSEKLGGVDGLYERVEELFEDANSIYASSNTGVQFRVVELRAVTGIPDDQPFDNLTNDKGEVIKESSVAIFSERLLNPGGFYDNNGNYQENYPEHATYQKFGGDIGIYLTDYRDVDRKSRLGVATQGGELTAIADEITLFDDAQSVASTLAHELGHNLGAHHEEGASRGSSDYEYARAYSCAGKRTVMWSNTRLSLDSQTQTFSSPNITLEGEACGEANFADNVRVITETKTSVSDRNSAITAIGSVSFRTSEIIVSESDGAFNVSLQRDGDLSLPASVALLVNSPNSLAGGDIKTIYKRIYFDVGQSEVSTSFDIVQDAINEGQERFDLNLVYPYRLDIQTGTTVLTVNDTDSGEPGDFVIESSPVEEGSVANVKIKREGGSDGEYLVNVSTELLKDAKNGATQNDFKLLSQEVIFGDGETEKTISIQTIENSAYTGDVVFGVSVSSAGELLAMGEVVITDMTQPDVEYSLSVGNPRAGETATLKISREGDVQSETSVRVFSADGSLKAGKDYQAFDSDVVFAKGEVEKTLSIKLTGNEAGSFSVTLSTGQSVTVSVLAPKQSDTGSGSTSGGTSGPLMILMLGILACIKGGRYFGVKR